MSYLQLLISVLIMFSASTNSQKFGKHLLDQFFIEKDYININHGSYGSPPRAVIAKHRQYQEECDGNTEKWYRYKIYEKYNATRKVVAEYVNADVDNIVLVENASDGVNSVLRSIDFQPGDKILIFDCAYVMVMSTLEYLVDHKKVKVVQMVLDKETINSDDLIIKKLEETIQQEGNIRLALFDHIPSTPHVIIPVKRMIEILRNHGIINFIDGAHTVGQIPLDIKDINPDFYLSNFHKWGYTPKSVSLLYARKELQNLIHPNIISVNYNKGWALEYAYTGTRDYSSIFSIPDALEFRRGFGESDIIKYMNDLAWEAGQTVAKIWGTEMLITDKKRIGSLVTVRIPTTDKDVISKAVYKGLYEHNVYIVSFKYNDGNYYTRLSCQIYNELSDYIYGANTFLKLINEIKAEKAEKLLKPSPKF